MLRKILLTIAIASFTGTLSVVFGQGVKPSVITGDVTSVSDTKIVVNSKTGPVDVILAAATSYKRIPPENPVLSAAVAATLADIGVGDKLMVTGILAADGRSVPAKSVFLMTKSDLSQKNAKEKEAWRTRGIAGKVSAINQQTGQITVDIRSLMGSTAMTVTPKADAKFIRYAPDSEKFDEAKPSSLAEIKAGDNIRALGDKNSDGTALSAETVLTGAFQTVAGTVVSADAAKNEVVIKNLQTNKEVTVSLGTASVLKRFPAEMAEGMARMQMGGGAGGGVQAIRPVTPGGQAQPAGGGQGQPGAGPRPMGGGRGGGIDEMLDRFPNITAADLKVGDMIAVSSSRSTDVDHIRAIKLLAGVEPFVRMAQMSQAAAGGRSGRGVDFNIPGLDGGTIP